MDKNFQKQVLSIVIGVLSGIVVTVILNFLGYFSIEINIIIGLIILCIILIFLLWHNWKSNLLTINIEKELGINHIYTKEKPTLENYVSSISTSFYFWGISAKRTMSNPNLQKKLIEIGHKKGGEIKFLLLNPKSPTVKRKAEDENDDANSWCSEIQATIQRLKSFGKNHNINIEIRVYDDFPIWRLCVIDNKKIYLNYFLSNQQGPESPLLEMTPVSNGIFWGFMNEFNETWNNKSVPV